MRRSVALLAAIVLTASACGGEEPTVPDTGAEGTTTPAATETDPAEDPTASETDDMAGATTVAVESSDLGDILVDGEGRTLYLFVPDEGGTPTCYDDCAANWPPLEGPADAGEGVDGASLATAERDDGTTQVTYGGWPLYYFAGDEQPGETNGQGLNDVWFVVGPDGEAVRSAAASTESGY